MREIRPSGLTRGRERGGHWLCLSFRASLSTLLRTSYPRNTRKEAIPGSTPVSGVGFGVPPKRTLNLQSRKQQLSPIRFAEIDALFEHSRRGRAAAARRKRITGMKRNVKKFRRDPI